jgi:hypothetical protein
MRKKIAIIGLVLVLVSYFVVPFLILPVNLVSFSIENPRPSKNGLYVNVTVVVSNLGIWPVELDDLHWIVAFPASDFHVNSAWSPVSIMLAPLQTIRAETVVGYTEEDLFIMVKRQARGEQVDPRIQQIQIVVYGRVTTLGIAERDIAIFRTQIEVTYR